MRTELEKAFPKMTGCAYEPALSDAQNYATGVSFGENVRLLPRFDRADVVLALDSDFLDCGEGDLAASRAFTARRRWMAGRSNWKAIRFIQRLREVPTFSPRLRFSIFTIRRGRDGL